MITSTQPGLPPDLAAVAAAVTTAATTSKLVVDRLSNPPEQLMQIYIRLLIETLSRGGDGERLRDLCFSNVSLAAFTLLPPLPRENNLRDLTICDCHLANTELEAVLTYSHSLETLNLTRNNIGDEGARTLAKFLSTNTCLQEVYLHFNDIGDEGALAIFDALEENSTLTTLNLESNRIELKAPALLSNTRRSNLKMLILACNEIGTAGHQAMDWLARLLYASESLKWLDLSECGLDALSDALIDTLQRNTCLEHLMLSANALGDVAATKFASVLALNSVLQCVDLAQNPIGLLGAEAMAKAILNLESRVYDLALDGAEVQRVVHLAMGTAALARNAFALRSAVEVRRLGTRSALRRLPRELCYLVAKNLAGLPLDFEQEYDEEFTDYVYEEPAIAAIVEENVTMI